MRSTDFHDSFSSYANCGDNDHVNVYSKIERSKFSCQSTLATQLKSPQPLTALATLPRVCAALIRNENAFTVVRRSRVAARWALWQTELPHVKAYYAVKANNDPVLISWLRAAGAGFDCASETEIRLALSRGAKPADIIYANPCKAEAAIRAADSLGVRLTTVDDPTEVEKLAHEKYRGSILLRLLVDDKASKMPFGRKFGCPLHYAPTVLAAAAKWRIPVRGISFHVGSEAALASQYANSLRDVRTAFDLAAQRGFSPDIVDIGGGFPGSDNNKFSEHAAAVRHAQQHLFPPSVTWMAEPGRFFASTSTTLFIRVIGTRPVHHGIAGSDAPQRVYMVNESLYSLFSSVTYDFQKPTFNLVRFAPDANGNLQYNLVHDAQQYSTDLYGHSCDSIDRIATNVPLPQLARGDYLCVDNMGAYTSVSASHFNGFQLPPAIYA